MWWLLMMMTSHVVVIASGVYRALVDICAAHAASLPLSLWRH
jgi:hypothetical protein